MLSRARLRLTTEFSGYRLQLDMCTHKYRMKPYLRLDVTCVNKMIHHVYLTRERKTTDLKLAIIGTLLLFFVNLLLD